MSTTITLIVERHKAKDVHYFLATYTVNRDGDGTLYTSEWKTDYDGKMVGQDRSSSLTTGSCELQSAVVRAYAMRDEWFKRIADEWFKRLAGD